MTSFNCLRVVPLAIASLLFAGAIAIFPVVSKAQKYPECFMIDRSGRIINLNRLCGTGEKPTPLITKRASSEPLTPREIAERSLKAVVQIESRNPSSENTSIGSGFFISSSGLLLTNAHVVGNNSVVQVRLSEKLTLEASVIQKSSKVDLALLKINSARLNNLSESISPTALPICYSDEVDVGERVVVVGNPWGLRNSVTQGVISGIRNSKTEKISNFEADIDLIQIDAAINLGNSGGPLIDEYGSVIGVVSASRILSEGISVAVPIQEAVREFNLDIPDACTVRVIKPNSTQ